MAGKHSRNKGNSEERSVVNLLRENGITCQRTLENGARSDGTKCWDIDVMLDPSDPDTATMIGECKVRASGFKTIYKWKANNDFLTIRADRQERLYVIGESLMIELLKLKQR